MAREGGTNPKTRILDAAEHAFAESGFDAASLRGIVLAARVNLATVYYYFGSKEGLLAAVFKRRFGPLRQEHLSLLRQTEAARGKGLSIEKLIEAMILPPLRLAAQASADSVAVRRLVGRVVTEPNPRMQELLRRQSGDVRTAFFEAFRRRLPGLPDADLHWRLEFLWGALAFVLCNPRKMERATGGVCNPLDTPTVVAEMVGFFSPGFRAPASSRSKRRLRPRRRSGPEAANLPRAAARRKPHATSPAARR